MNVNLQFIDKIFVMMAERECCKECSEFFNDLSNELESHRNSVERMDNELEETLATNRKLCEENENLKKEVWRLGGKVDPMPWREPRRISSDESTPLPSGGVQTKIYVSKDHMDQIRKELDERRQKE